MSNTKDTYSRMHWVIMTALTLTPSCSVQLYWMSWDRSLTPSDREMVLFKRLLGSGNSFSRLPNYKNNRHIQTKVNRVYTPL